MKENQLSRDHGIPLYEQVADRIASMVDKGAYRPGDRVPSIRGLSKQMKVSVNTVREAYGYLEDRRVIEARPQSGYYVCAKLPDIPEEPIYEEREIRPTEIGMSDLVEMVMRNTGDPDLVQLGATMPDPDLLPVDRLSRMLYSQIRRYGNNSVSYALPPGYERLRKQIARRMADLGCSIRPDDVVITSGCTEAIFLALMTVCNPGDTLAVESPTYFNFFQLIQEMGLKAIEIPSTPLQGMSIEALQYALETTKVSACLVIPNFSNPIGGVMPDDRKAQLVSLLDRHGIPLIEDDINGDLSHTDERPVPVKSFDGTGNVLLCSSFTKTIAGGYRVGYIVPGRYRARVERLKLLTSIASATPTQMAIAEFLANGGYDRHLRNLRRAYGERIALLGEAIGRYFPEGTRVTRPKGGFTLWVEMPEEVDALKLYDGALARGITIAPGPVFSASGKFGNCVRLNAAFFTERDEGAVKTLGGIARALQ